MRQWMVGLILGIILCINAFCIMFLAPDQEPFEIRNIVFSSIGYAFGCVLIVYSIILGRKENHGKIRGRRIRRR